MYPKGHCMLLTQLVRDEVGQDLAEYGVAMAILSMGIVFAIYNIRNNLRTIWDYVADSLR
jgi:Flp pilus assembly pilin Flp